jgi:hypothetical protein
MGGDCIACKLLSEKFSEATKTYFEVLLKSQLARNANNPALLSEFEALTLAAAEKRGSARWELRQHEATHLQANRQTA